MSFFGKDQGLIVYTINLKDKVHLNFIQKVENKWQKGIEGLQVALEIKEICEIAEFLEKKDGIVNIIHSSPSTSNVKNYLFEFNKEKSILFVKAKYDNRPDYRKFSKPVQKGELRALIKLWNHMENEKIENYNALDS